ncbi:MAG: CPBP family intramembrane metalloprotease [Dehalococcoidia bacterium]|nr:CPBP family intramembrane metalloprotease [Dehalococcoidia bacterium]
MLFGVLAGAAVVLVMNLLLLGLVEAAGAELQTRDVGDAFEKAGEVAIYAGERLRAAATGEELPEPPTIQADQTAIALGLATTLALNVVLVGVVAAVTRQRTGELASRLGLRGFDPLGLWRPMLAVVGCYAMVVGYAAIVDALDIGVLQPESTVPFEVMREQLTVVLTGVAVVAVAPLAEEVFYRGLLFGGLQRWGFWPAALISGVVFSGVHLDPGSLIPFFIIGVVLAWLFWRRGNLWESVAFHVIFNAVSFSLLLATEA